MRTLLAVTALLLAPSALLAQAPATIVLQSAGAQNCPVGIQAQHTPQGAVEQVGRGAQSHQLGYNISLRAFDSRLIRQARITLRGISGAQILPAGSSDSSANATESFTLTPGATPKATLQSVVYAEKLTGVRWVEVDDLTYADGTTWRQAQGSVCRVAPNGFLLVNAAR